MLIAGCQHQTNTFASIQADGAALHRGDRAWLQPAMVADGGFHGQGALSPLFDPLAAEAVVDAGVGAELGLAPGKAVPTFNGQPSDPPVPGRFKVLAVADGRRARRSALAPSARRDPAPALKATRSAAVAAAASAAQAR